MTSTVEFTRDYVDFCQQRLANPYPLFDRLREEDPVHWCKTMQCWLVTRYDDVFDNVRDPRFSSSRSGLYMDNLRPENREKAKPLLDHLSKWMLNVDPPDHTRLRRLVNAAFSPRMLKSLEPRIEQLVDRLLDDVCRARRVDFVRDFSYRLTATVICQMLGVPSEMQDNFRAGAEILMNFSSAAGPRLNDHVDTARKSLEELINSFDHLIELRNANPQDDLISAMLAVNESNDRFSQEELFSMCVFLFVAGHETTMSIISSGMMLLIQNRDQYDLLKHDPTSLAPTATEEFVRLESSVTRGVRMAKENIELRGRVISKGETIVNVLGAANRDPRQFRDPDIVDIQREPNKHLGFGFGPHFCLGAPLARLEAGIAFRNIAQRKLEFRITCESLTWRANLGIRTLSALPLELITS